MIAVCLLTCDRPELTRLAAQSFVLHHDGRDDLLALHCDGGSVTDENVQIAEQYGFLTLVAPPRSERIGQMATLRRFVEEAVAAQCDWMLWLENDWEFVHAVPSPEFFRRLSNEGVETVRLFGTQKMKDGHRRLAGIRRILTRERIDWQPSSILGWEYGRAHWGAGGTLIQTDILQRHLHRSRLKDIIKAENNLRSVRPYVNLMWCNGLITTEGILP